MRRCRRMGHRQPHMERKDPRFESEPGQKEQKSPHRHPRRPSGDRCRRTPNGRRAAEKSLASPRHHKPAQKQEETDVHQHQIAHRRMQDLFSLPVEHHEQERTQGHQLPPEQKSIRVFSPDHLDHGVKQGHQRRKMERHLRMAFPGRMSRHIADRVHGTSHSTDRHRQCKDSADRVQPREPSSGACLAPRQDNGRHARHRRHHRSRGNHRRGSDRLVTRTRQYERQQAAPYQ